MKRQIAEFLGELAEELGWEPELEDQRVRLEPQTTTPVGILNISSRTEPELPARTRVASSPPDLNTEVRHLRSSLNHLSSEVTHLRAEMARLKKLPAPPDSERDASTAAGMGDVRPWPAHLVPQPAPEPLRDSVPVEPPSVPVAVEPPRVPIPVEPLRDPVSAEPLREPVPVEPSQDPVQVEPLRDPISTEPPRDPVPAEPLREPLSVEPLREPESATPVPTEIDADSPLELFPSEPRSAKDPTVSP